MRALKLRTVKAEAIMAATTVGWRSDRVGPCAVNPISSSGKIRLIEAKKVILP